MILEITLFLLVGPAINQRAVLIGCHGGSIKNHLTYLISPKSLPGLLPKNIYSLKKMSTLPAGGSAFGSISNAPGRQDEDELKNRTHTTKNVVNGVSTTTTVPATFADQYTTVPLNGSVRECKTAIRAIRRADRVPAGNVANKTGRVTRLDA